MRTWFTAPYRAVTVSVICVVLTVLALIIVVSGQGISERTVAASLLVLTFMVFTVGGVLYTGRAMLKWQIADIRSYLIWERVSIITATLATLLGLVLLEDILRAAGDSFLARLGMVTYLFGALLVVAAETTYLNKNEWNYAQVVAYVMLAFLAQTAFGIALLQTGLVPAWVGWTTVIWNLGLLVVMLIVRPKDIYYPVIHYVAPLIIGIALLAGGWG